MGAQWRQVGGAGAPARALTVHLGEHLEGIQIGQGLAFGMERLYADVVGARFPMGFDPGPDRVVATPGHHGIDEAVGTQGRRIVFLLRLSPIFPFNLLNYALGLTKVRLRDYVLASVGMIPGTLLYVYYGKLAGDVAALAGGVAPERGAAYYTVLGVGLVATLLVTVFVTRLAKKALSEATGE